MQDNSKEGSIMEEKAKEIIFEGATYKVPVWVKFVAKDEDGQVYAYENKPAPLLDAWGITKGKAFYVSGGNDDWDESLTKVQ